MKHVLYAFVSMLLCATEALAQTPLAAPPPAYNPYSYIYAPTPTPQPWYYDAMAWLNLSPVTKKNLYDNDPTVCHTDECRRARLAAGIEYMGYKPYRVPAPGLIPPVYTPTPPPLDAPIVKPRPSAMLIYCRSLDAVVTRAGCPGR